MQKLIRQHTFRVSVEEEAMINALCARTNRTLSDLIRYGLWGIAIKEGIAVIPETDLFIVPKEVMNSETPVKQP